ncbi:MAG TPA: OmpA family protein, partial [Chthoniobacteraceae bacterium]
GSFGGIYQSAIYAYGSSLIKNPVDSDHFVKADALHKLDKAGAFAGQQVSITPIRSKGAAPLENDPLLSKNIRFLFDANSSTLNLTDQGNLDNLAALHRLLQVSPGSRLLLRGHVDNALIGQFRKEGGEQRVRERALSAIQLSKDRANEIKRLLVEREKIDPARLDTIGRGWEEPLGTNSEANRRVEAQWFTIE